MPIEKGRPPHQEGKGQIRRKLSHQNRLKRTPSSRKGKTPFFQLWKRTSKREIQENGQAEDTESFAAGKKKS